MKIKKLRLFLLALPLLLTSCDDGTRIISFGGPHQEDQFDEFSQKVHEFEEVNSEDDVFLFPLDFMPDYEWVFATYNILGELGPNHEGTLINRTNSVLITEILLSTDGPRETVMPFCYFEYNTYFPKEDSQYCFVKSETTISSPVKLGLPSYVTQPKQYNLIEISPASEGTAQIGRIRLQLLYFYDSSTDSYFVALLNHVLNMYEHFQ